MERFTTKQSDGIYYINQLSVDNSYVNGFNCYYGKIVDRLAEFENFMEEQGFESLEELKNKLENTIILKPDKYIIVTNNAKNKRYGIAKVYQQVLDIHAIQTGYIGDITPHREYGEFATLEEAQSKLREIKRG